VLRRINWTMVSAIPLYWVPGNKVRPVMMRHLAHSIPHNQRSLELSLRVKCRINRLEQSRVAEWLEQAFHGTLFDQPPANDHISISRNEDDRNRLSPLDQFLLKIRPGRSRHSDIEEQASGLVDAIRREELFRRRESAGCKPELLQ
jgi:hypothetical protein